MTLSKVLNPSPLLDPFDAGRPLRTLPSLSRLRPAPGPPARDEDEGPLPLLIPSSSAGNDTRPGGGDLTLCCHGVALYCRPQEIKAGGLFSSLGIAPRSLHRRAEIIVWVGFVEFAAAR